MRLSRPEQPLQEHALAAATARRRSYPLPNHIYIPTGRYIVTNTTKTLRAQRANAQEHSHEDISVPVFKGDPIPTNVGPKFKLKIRGRTQTDAHAKLIEGPTATDAFDAALALDVSALSEPIISWRDREQAVALDFDRPPEAAPLVDDDVERFISPSAPTPRCAWTTHGGGLRLIFVAVDGVAARTLAGLWLMIARLGPLLGWRLEVKTDTRHPAGLREGVTCGRVFCFAPSAEISLRSDAGSATEEEIAAWLAANNLTMGRHGAELCPWSCGQGSGSPPVLVTDHGIRCFKCGRSASWAKLVGGLDVDGK